jgi:hypothetical protein
VPYSNSKITKKSVISALIDCLMQFTIGLGSLEFRDTRAKCHQFFHSFQQDAFANGGFSSNRATATPNSDGWNNSNRNTDEWGWRADSGNGNTAAQAPPPATNTENGNGNTSSSNIRIENSRRVTAAMPTPSSDGWGGGVSSLICLKTKQCHTVIQKLPKNKQSLCFDRIEFSNFDAICDWIQIFRNTG